MHPILGRRGLLPLYITAFLLLGALLAVASIASRAEWAAAAALALPLALLLGFLCLAAWFPCRATPLAGSGPLRITSTHLFAALFVCGLWLSLGGAFAAALVRFAGLSEASEIFARERSLYFAVGFFLYLLATAYNYLVMALDSARRTEAEALELKVLAREAELAALKAQIDPHFLFNSLNSVASLCGSDAAAAREMALSLASFLRASRAAAGRAAIPLSEELELAASYLAIEKVRFGERLKVVQRVDEGARSWLIPPLILQPVVENAVRHGVAHCVAGGEVRIEALLAGERLRLIVTNPYDPTSRGKSRGTGTGLENVRRRLRLLFGFEARLVTERQEELFTVEIELPRSLAAEGGA